MSTSTPRTALIVGAVAAFLLVPAASVGAGESVSVTAEYVEYVNRDGVLNIGPYVDLRLLFHAANLGPDGVACTADRVDVVRNDVEFRFDSAGGPVTGAGLIELSCEYHVGCGAVTRIVEAAYRGTYDPSAEWMSGTVDITVPEGESTGWELPNPGEPGRCGDRRMVPGTRFSDNWVLNLAETPATGYQSIQFDKGDPRNRAGLFSVSVLTQSVGDDADASVGEPAEGTVDESGVESSNATSVTVGGSSDVDDGSRIGGFILAVALLLGVTAAILLVRRLLGHGVPLSTAAAERDARESQQASQTKAQAESAWFNEQATHVIEPGQTVWVPNPKFVEQGRAKGMEISPGWDAPLPISLEPAHANPHNPAEDSGMVPAAVRDGVTVIYDPDHPGIAVLRTGVQIWIRPEQLTALPTGEFTPAHEVIGTGMVEIQTPHQVVSYPPGTPVEVVTTTGDQVLVRVDAKTKAWVPRSRIGPSIGPIEPPQ